ncbi:hypothetical protein AQUCO_01000263v1 [Aquilegia coerulea]|uniref:Glycosyltransferase n=1 Tax=Aquilegia coerulea TaxID=218851 RepID=A0A2G5E926_AQUCA|nr:hypothetical protein AQUCO_01000263v1 [Aquilegia coerulea]
MARDLLHVVMFPWLAFGHMIPFFQLAIALAKAGIQVSFISTPKNIQRLPSIPSELEPLLQFVKFQLPFVDGLPRGAEATVDITMEENQFLKKSYDLLEIQFKKFITCQPVDWIIQDFAAYWAAEIAEELSIPQIMFSVFSTAVLAFFGPPVSIGKTVKVHWTTPESLTMPPKWITFPSTVAFRQHEANAFFAQAFQTNESGIPDSDRGAKVLQASKALVVRSCKEYEGDYLNVAKKIYLQPVIPIGLLPPLPQLKKSDNNEIESSAEVFKWLDHQKDKSVVYVGFGSEVKLDREQVYEIAIGLELANLPFLWALRKPMWAVNENDALPSGFRSRTAHLGMVLLGWAPQLDILAHPSVGGSMFHSGWGSIIETLQHGHILVVLPLVIDQGLNARLLVEKGLAIEVEKSDDGTFNGEDIAKALRKAMVNEESESLRFRANEMRAVFSNQELHYEVYMSKFVQYLKA